MGSNFVIGLFHLIGVVLVKDMAVLKDIDMIINMQQTLAIERE